MSLPQCDYDKTPLQWRKGNTVFFRDTIIDEGLRKHFSNKEIYDYYCSQDLYTQSDITEKLEVFKEKLKTREKDWDVKVYDYIMNSYQKTQLFYDPSHPTNELMEYIVCEIKRILLGENFARTAWDTDKIQKLDITEMPVPSIVRNTLNINYPIKNLRESSYSRKVRRSIMDLQEYINQYVLLSWRNDELNFWIRASLFVKFMFVKVLQIFKR